MTEQLPESRDFRGYDGDDIETVAREITMRGVTVPAVLFLEANRGAGSLDGLGMLFFDPAVRRIFGGGIPGASSLLADDDGIDRLIDRLERSGLVERRVCGSDRRGTYVSLTPRGQDVFKKAGRVHLRGIDEHVGSHLTHDELAQLTALLGKLADRVGGEALSTLAPDTP